MWLLDLSRGALSRFTTDPVAAFQPRWSPDGSRIAYAAIRRSFPGLFQKPSRGGAEEPLFQSDTPNLNADWSPDGRFLVYESTSGMGRLDVWLLPLLGIRKPAALLQSQFNEMHARISSDGRWIAYASDESGRSEVYLSPFRPGQPIVTARIQVSTGGGAEPAWRRDGRELYYVTPDNRLVAVSILSDGSNPRIGTATLLFLPRLEGTAGSVRNHYAVTAGGDRFLVRKQGTTVTPVTVVLNLGESR